MFIMKASTPGKTMAHTVWIVALSVPQNSSWEKTLPQPSNTRLHVASVTPMIGASQNRVAIGLFMPIDSLWSKSCVSDHRRPPSADAVRTWTMPTASNCVSVETMRTTPDVMMRMMPTSRHDGTSRRNRKAKMRTKASDDDLHMAARDRGQLVRYLKSRREVEDAL